MVDIAATVSRSCDPWRAAARAAASDVGTTRPQLRMPSCRRLVVVAHPHEELCADHDAVGRAAATACSAYRLPLLRYPIDSGERLRSSDMTQGQVRHLTLTEAVRTRKHRALVRLRAQSPTADVEQVATTEEFLVSCRKARG